MKRLMTTMVLAATLLASCEQDAYEKGDGTLSYMRADFVEAAVNGQKQVTSATTDDGARLTLTMPLTASWIAKGDTTYRAVLYYNARGSNDVEPLNIQRITTVGVKKAQAIKDGVKTDPIGLESIWLSGSGKYLNMSVLMKTGTTDSGLQVQTLGMVGDSISKGGDGKQTYHLRLYHSQHDVPEYYTQRVYFSVPVKGLGVDSLRVRIRTYEGVIEKKFALD